MAVEYVFCKQSVHSAFPLPDAYFPALHSAHVVVCQFVEADPALHAHFILAGGESELIVQGSHSASPGDAL